jgi:hypothetical protein
MSDETPDLSSETPAEDSLTKDRKEFRELLVAGAVCSLVVAGLQVASEICGLNEEWEPDHFTWSLGLALGAMLPQFIVAAAFWELGQKAGDRSLSVGSMGCFLSLWAFNLLHLASEEYLPGWLRVLLVVVVGFIVLCAVGLIAEEYPDLSRSRSNALVVLGLVWVGAGVAVAYWLGLRPQKFVILTTAVVMAVLLGGLVFPVWWSVALMRGRSRYGELSLLLGLGQLFAWAATLGILSLGVLGFREALGGPLGFDEALFRQKVEPVVHFDHLFGLVCSGLWGITLAWFFWSLRDREPEKLWGKTKQSFRSEETRDESIPGGS